MKIEIDLKVLVYNPSLKLHGVYIQKSEKGEQRLHINKMRNKAITMRNV